MGHGSVILTVAHMAQKLQSSGSLCPISLRLTIPPTSISALAVTPSAAWPRWAASASEIHASKTLHIQSAKQAFVLHPHYVSAILPFCSYCIFLIFLLYSDDMPTVIFRFPVWGSHFSPLASQASRLGAENMKRPTRGNAGVYHYHL